MNGCLTTIQSLLNELLQLLDAKLSKSCVILPPAIYLQTVSQLLAKSGIKYGIQNIYPLDSGAYTGEISGLMAKDFGCSYVLVGHSERRCYFNEDEKFLAEKFHYVIVHDMIPVLCVGETLKERQNGLTESVIASQLQVITDEYIGKNFVIAYEPMWAIGTGITPKPQEIQDVHNFIRSCLVKIDINMGQTTSILYGGSLNDTNAELIFAMPDVDGGLIGAASLNAHKFVEILKCIS